MPTKQVIVMRTDLNMTKGKMVAQGAHASMAFITRRIQRAFPHRPSVSHVVELWTVEQNWLNDSFVKICVKVNSEEELLSIKADAEAAHIECHLITDDGRTMFDGVPTNTCLALGPDLAERLDPLTGHLKLL